MAYLLRLMPKLNESSVVVGPARLAEITGKSVTWARNLLKSWLDEQERGGPQRVFLKGKKRAMATTLAIVQRELLGSIRDPHIMRKLDEHDRDLDTLARRIDRLTSELNALRPRRAS